MKQKNIFFLIILTVATIQNSMTGLYPESGNVCFDPIIKIEDDESITFSRTYKAFYRNCFDDKFTKKFEIEVRFIKTNNKYIGSRLFIEELINGKKDDYRKTPHRTFMPENEAMWTYHKLVDEYKMYHQEPPTPTAPTIPRN